MKSKLSFILQCLILFFSTSKFSVYGIDADRFAFILFFLFTFYIVTLFFIQRHIIKYNKNQFYRFLISSIILELFLIFNCNQALQNGINFYQWISESYFLCLLPIIVIVLFISQSLFGLKNILNPLIFTGLIEVILIYLSAFQEGFSNRATHFLGVYVMSHLIYLFEFWVLFAIKNVRLKILLFFIIIYALILTGSRMAFLSGVIVGLPFLLKNKIFFPLSFFFSFLFLDIESLALFQRQYNLDDDLSSLGKYSEVSILWNWFLENPIFGKGIGVFYNNGVDLSDFNYSHNMYFWFLGYTGMVITIIYFNYIKNFILINFKSNWSLYFSILLYYFSSTTFTTLKFTFFIIVFFILSTKKLSIQNIV